VNGVACALLDRAPLLVITDAHPASADGATHQRIDQRALFAPITKWSVTLTSERVDAIMIEAIQRSMTSPRGPVHLECPADVTVVSQQSSVLSHQASDVSPTSAVVARLMTEDWRLTTARKPLAIAGLGARRHAEAVRAFIAAHRVPAMVTYKAKGVVSDRDPWFAGVFTNGALEREISDESDLVIAVGLDRVELLPRPWTPRQPLVDIAEDVAPALERLAPQLQSTWDASALPRTMARQRERLNASRAAMTPADVVRIASAALPKARVTVDAGAHMFPATLLWPIDEPGGMLISNGLSTMGFALPAAIGAALADRGRTVVALTGDGGLLMCGGELATLARERLNVVVIVFNDRSLSLIDVKQRQRGYARTGVALGDVSWQELAHAYGLESQRAETVDEFERAVTAASACREPCLIDAHVDPMPYEEMIRRVRG
jgi:acetolactate synthase-1/2/3 large subunit